MRIAILASEGAPYVKSGGLGDVMEALPSALSRIEGNEVALFLPYYKKMLDNPSIETELVKMLGEWEEFPVTYAGGVGNFADLEMLKVLGQNRVNVTIGSALDFDDIIPSLDFGNGEGIEVHTKSNLPLGSGLSSSSALSNAVVMATAALVASEFCLEPLTDMEMINMGIDASLEAGVTITGAFEKLGTKR